MTGQKGKQQNKRRKIVDLLLTAFSSRGFPMILPHMIPSSCSFPSLMTLPSDTACLSRDDSRPADMLLNPITVIAMEWGYRSKWGKFIVQHIKNGRQAFWGDKKKISLNFENHLPLDRQKLICFAECTTHSGEL